MQVNIDLQINDIYVPFLLDNTRTQIIYGGSSSGKSLFLIGQRMILDLVRGGRNYLALRNTGNTLRTSVYNEAVKGIYAAGLQKYFKINKSEMTVTCKNGYQAILKGLDDVEKIKSITPARGAITDILIEEATETNADTLKQLRKRLRGKTEQNESGEPLKKRITLCFNPIYKTHWIYKEFFEGRFSDSDKFYKDDDLLILKTTYKDNLRFLEQDDIKDLETEKNPYFHNVYTLGNWGVLGDLIFDNWKIEDLSYKDEFSYYDNGLDFGYANDPTALNRSSIKGKNLFITHELYEKGMTNDVIAENIKPIIGKEVLYCDSAEPKSIAELRMYGITAIGAMKGPGSLNYGIQYLQQFNIIIDKSCQNTINEVGLYQWAKDKEGNTINQPVDKFNHSIDALRYAHSRHISQKRKQTTTDPREVGVYLP